jgi:integrase
MPRVDYALSPEQRIDAREAFRLIEGTGLSLVDVVKRGLGEKRASHRALTNEVVRLFLISRREEGCRPKTIAFYADFLRPIAEQFGDRVFDTITRAELAKCIQGATDGATARTSIARASRALWRWAMARPEPMAAVDASMGLRFIVAKKEGRKPAVLTVEQCGAILAGAGHFRGALALMLGAGVRPEEIRGPGKEPMRWRDIDITHSAITVRAECSKTRKERIIENPPPMLWQWITPGNSDEPISPALARSIIDVAKTAAGLKKWTQDATRHTFASYALALTQDPGKVALWLGHEESPKMLFNHYHRPGLRAPAVAFFSLCNEGAVCPFR